MMELVSCRRSSWSLTLSRNLNNFMNNVLLWSNVEMKTEKSEPRSVKEQETCFYEPWNQSWNLYIKTIKSWSSWQLLTIARLRWWEVLVLTEESAATNGFSGRNCKHYFLACEHCSYNMWLSSVSKWRSDFAWSDRKVFWYSPLISDPADDTFGG